MNRVLSALAVAALVVLSDGHAIAQQPAASAAQGQPSASHLAAAREVVNLSGMARSFDAVLPRFGEAIRKNAVTRPDLTKDLDDVLEKLKPELELQKQQMVTASARIFAGSMTEQELRDTATFFKTPSGQKYVASQPAVLDEMVRQMEMWTRDVSEYVMVRVRAEMGKRGHSMQ